MHRRVPYDYIADYNIANYTGRKNSNKQDGDLEYEEKRVKVKSVQLEKKKNSGFHQSRLPRGNFSYYRENNLSVGEILWENA